ncbi:class I SAM-dependent methyltransferase [Pedobacter nutrimenti]|uniref:Methyltransferase family protein n=1 Tax=Pedobacter nutrimenti TaxID=1241337 RepID=A0A318UNR8_9SPHI|nr:class I SAM-dependent methyltransferase [Pedobacter nutrimenti]PYF77097.1 methyltransferase family protein [Pedobacter nutrimenti]
MNQVWDERYKEQEFAYGKEPNLFFKEWLLKLKPGAILMPADGEGRNGVYAAGLNWQVTSFDFSEQGQSKALGLAKERGVNLEYRVGDLKELEFGKESFDAIGLIYAHFSTENKSAFHHKLNAYLKPGGMVVFEAFSKNHIAYRERNPKVGGPTDAHMLYSCSEIEADFENFEILLLKEEEVLLKEGKYHIGMGSVIRFIGRKLY